MASSSSSSIERACASLTLQDEETKIINLGEEDIGMPGVNYSLVLVGRLVINKPIKFPIMRDTLATVWRPGKGVRITEAAPNLFTF